MKNFLATKDIIKKVRIQPREWEKNLQKDVSNKCLIAKIYKECLQLNRKRTQIKN